MKTLCNKVCLIFTVPLLFLALTINESTAQDAQVFVDLQVDESLTNSQVVNLVDIASNNGQGPKLFDFFLQNENTQNRAEDLYLNLKLSSDKVGLIIDLYQKQGQPFSMDAGQQVHATNNTLEDGIPGISESVRFDGGLTTDGEEFINKLEGSTKLPPDRYVIEITVTQFQNGQNGGVLAGDNASSVAEIGGNIAEDFRDIYLTSPGDVVGSEVEINTLYPEFRWEGSLNSQYRLIIVEAKSDDSPESLIDGARSSDPILENGAVGSGSLLEYEMLDARLKSTSFQYPTSGVQELKPGNQYYWQIFNERQGSSGIEIINSEIWSFVLKDDESGLSLSSDGEVGRNLQQIMQGGQFEELQREGFTLGSIEIGGEVVTGQAVLQKLIDFRSKIENGEITIVNN